MDTAAKQTGKWCQMNWTVAPYWTPLPTGPAPAFNTPMACPSATLRRGTYFDDQAALTLRKESPFNASLWLLWMSQSI